MICPKCGKQITDHSQFCGYCGADLTTRKNNAGLRYGIIIGSVLAVLVLTAGTIFIAGAMQKKNKREDAREDVSVTTERKSETKTTEADARDTEKPSDTEESKKTDVAEDMDYKTVIEEMKKGAMSDSSMKRKLWAMANVTLMSSVFYDADEEIEFKKISGNKQGNLNWHIVKDVLWNDVFADYPIDRSRDSEYGKYLDKKELKQLFRDFYGCEDQELRYTEGFEDVDSETVAFIGADGESVVIMNACAVWENDKHYLISGPCFYTDDISNAYVYSADFLFSKEQNGFGATVLYGRTYRNLVKVASVTTSSQLADYQGKTYGGNNLIDGDLDTAWVEGVEGVGKGEEIVLHLSEPTMVYGLGVYNGYLASEDLLMKNGKVEQFNVSFGARYSDTLDMMSYIEPNGDGVLNDYEIDHSFLFLDKPVMVDTITLKIKSAQAGYKYEDTCVSEIEVY